MRRRQIVVTQSAIVALLLTVGAVSAQPVITCRRSSAEAFVIAYRIAGSDLKRFLYVINQQFQNFGLTRDLFRGCFPAGEAVLRKIEQCVQNNEQICTLLQREAEHDNWETPPYRH
jgi:hypothetical protein